MKFIFSFFCILCAGSVYAQTIEKYYDYNWKETELAYARFVSVINYTDSGWHRSDYYLHEKNNLQMDGTYIDSAYKIPNGIFYYFHPNGKVKRCGKYINGKKQGLWLSYHSNGMMSDSTFYEQDKINGISESWYSNGYIEDSTTVNNGIETYIGWFDDGTIASAGRYNENNKKIGKWQFFHHNGKLASAEIYDNGLLIDKKYFDENGTSTDTSNVDKPAKFMYKGKNWTEYISSKLYFPSQYKITNSDKAAVLVEFTVSETGKIEDINIEVPFYRPFNDIVINVLRNSPLWKPAVMHNRFVRCRYRQLVNFAQSEY